MTASILPVAEALAVLDLYAHTYADRHGQRVPTGLRAYRQGLGPVLMVPDAQAADADAVEGDQVYVCDTTGNGNPAVVLEGAVAFCGCCLDVSGCWTRAVQDAADARRLGVFLESYASWAVSIYPA